MKALYTVKEAAEAVGVSKAALRKYTSTYARFLSTEATPERGEARLFTPDDLRVIRFVFEQTNAGATHQQVTERLNANELALFQWYPPDVSVDDDVKDDGETTAIVPADMVKMAQALIDEALQREAAAVARERALQDRVESLLRELGEAQGRIAAEKETRYNPPKWIRALFGSRGS